MRKLQLHRNINGVLVCLILLMTLGVCVGTYAFYTASTDVQNRIKAGDSEVYLQELFSPDDLWLAGETKTKEVVFGNQGESDQVIRFKVTVEWYDNNGTPNNLSDDIPWAYVGTYSPEPVVINFTSEITGLSATWTKIGDYYYYNNVLAGQSGSSPTETLPVIDSVTFSNAISNAEYEFGDDFSNKAVKITVEMQALRVDKSIIEDAWTGVVFTPGAGGAITWTPKGP